MGGRLKRIARALVGSLGQFRVRDAVLLVPAAGSAVALDRSGVDGRFTDFTREDDYAVSSLGEWGGWPLQFSSAGATMLVGHVRGDSRVADFGEEALAAILETEILTQAAKASVRRQRPDRANRRSMPSGHAGKTAAMAVVTWRHFGWKGGVPATALAAATAFSRVDHQKHYLSDVILGALGGVVVAGMVDRFYDEERVQLVESYAEPQPITVGDVRIGHRTVAGVRVSW